MILYNIIIDNEYQVKRVPTQWFHAFFQIVTCINISLIVFALIQIML